MVSPVIRFIFCKDGKELYSQKAQQRQLSYSVVLNIPSKITGIHVLHVGNVVSSPASPPPQVSDSSCTSCTPGGSFWVSSQNWVSFNVVSSPGSPPLPAPHAWIPHNLPTGTAISVVTVGLVLLAAGSWFAIRKGTCRGRCPRQQHVDRPQMETTDHGEVTYSTIAHVRRDRVSHGTAVQSSFLHSCSLVPAHCVGLTVSS
eukprot:XP_027303712.1 uncharacterized protein LOC113841225 [Anas platyrhynchos]